jgi:hypothetical protein
MTNFSIFDSRGQRFTRYLFYIWIANKHITVIWTWTKVIMPADAPKFVNCILWVLWEYLKCSEICESLKLRGWNISLEIFDTTILSWNLTTPHLTCNQPTGEFLDIRTAEANISLYTFFLFISLTNIWR